MTVSHSQLRDWEAQVPKNRRNSLQSPSHNTYRRSWVRFQDSGGRIRAYQKIDSPPFRWLIRRRSEGGRSFSVGRAFASSSTRSTFLDLPKVVRQISTSPADRTLPLVARRFR